MPESTSSSESETITRLKKTSRDVIDYLTTLGALDLASLSKEAEERRVKLRQDLIEILSLSPDGLVNGDGANGVLVQDAGMEDLGAEDYEVPTSSTLKTKLEEADRVSTASIEKKATSKSGISQSKSNTDMKVKKKTLTRMKSTPIVELPKKEDRKKEGNLIEKKLMRRTVQHWAVLSPEILYLAKSSSETHSEMKIRLHSASVSAQKNMREFVIKRQGKSYLLRAESDEDCQSWIEQIQLCITEVNQQDCQFSDEEDDAPPVSPAVDTTSDDKISPGPEELYENENETPKVEENEAENDDVYDDVEAPVVATPATLSEPDRTESISSTTSSSSTTKRVSIFGGIGKNKDSMPLEGKLSGFVQKKGKFSWDKKWFVLCDQTLYYSNSDTDKKCQGTLSLAGASIDTKSGNESRPFAINIKYKGNKMLLAWDDNQLYDDWLKAIKSAAGDDQSSEPTTSEKDLKVDYDGDGEEEEAEEPQEDYVNPDPNPPAEEADGDDVYDDVVPEPQKSDSISKPAPVQQKQPPVKKPIQGGGKSELKDPEHSSYLHRKTTGIIKKWERKWFFIVDKTLYMSTTEEEESYKNLLALTNVAEVIKGSVDKYHYAITLQLKPSCGKDIILAADTKEEQSLWVAKLNEGCDMFSCELSSDEEDGAYFNKPPAPEPQAPQVPPVPQVEEEEETVRVDDQGFIMEDIYEDVSQPLDAPPQPPPPKEPPKIDSSAPSLPPRNPNLKPTVVVPSVPSLPPRNQPATPKSASVEPEPIMDEFYEDMDEVKAQYENAKNVMDQKADAVEEPPVAKNEPPTTKKDLSVSKADTEKKSPLLKKKELKKEKEQQKKEAKKKEKESKKLKKEKGEKERSKSLSKPRSKSAELKIEDKRSNSLTVVSTSKPAEDDEEYVIEELTVQDEKPGVDEPEPIDEEIYEDVDEPPIPSPRTTAPSSSMKKPTPPPTVATTSTKTPASSLPRSDVLSPPGTVSDFKRSSSPVTEPSRSQSASPGNVKIRTTGITVSSISKPKPPTSVTPVTTTTSSSSTITTKTTSNEKSTSTTSITTSSVKTAATKTTSSPLNKPRVRVSEAIYKFQKRSSTVDGTLHSGKLFHKAPGRTKFRQEYCEISGTVLSFYREQGDERAFATLSLEECELRIVKEQYEGRRYVFCLAAGSSSDMLSTELNADLQKWLSVLEPLVKKYVNEE